MINIVYEDNHLLVVEKPVNIPVQKDSTNDMDLLSILKQYLKEKYKKPGNVYLGLVHRLDRPVGGIMVFAKTSKSSSRLSEQIRNHQFHKEYYAVIDGIVKENSGTFKDKLLKNNKTNTVTISESGKDAELDYKVVKKTTRYTLVSINLKTGRSHQIRVQFAYHNYPLYGDQRYNKNSVKGQQIALFSKKVTFKHPITKEIVSFECNLPKSNIWKQFEVVK